MAGTASPKKSSRGMVIVIVVVAVALLAVPCIGVLAAIAIPAFVGYLTRAKTAEAEANLATLHRSAAAYYALEHFVGGAPLTGCTVGSASTDNVTGAHKTVLTNVPPEFEALGVSFLDPIYYRYEIVSAGGCGHPAGAVVYTFRAHGDLDGDGSPSLFETVVTSDGADGLTRAPIVPTDELE